MKQSFLYLLSVAIFLIGCAGGSSKPAEIETGSAISGSFFADSSQFANSRVKLRIRDTSGDELLNIGRLKDQITSTLATGGYSESDEDFGILIDVNTVRLSSVANAGGSRNSGLGTIIGGVLGGEVARKGGEVTQTSGIILGAIAGTAIESILKTSGTDQTYVLVAEVNVGVRRLDESANATISIGKSRFKQEQSDSVYEAFAMSDKLVVIAYGGGKGFSKAEVLGRIEARIARVIGGIL